MIRVIPTHCVLLSFKRKASCSKTHTTVQTKRLTHTLSISHGCETMQECSTFVVFHAVLFKFRIKVFVSLK